MRKLAVTMNFALICIQFSACKGNDLSMKWGNFRNVSEPAFELSETIGTRPATVELCFKKNFDSSPTCVKQSEAMDLAPWIPVAISDIMAPQLRFFYDDKSKMSGTFGPDLGIGTISEFAFPFEVLSRGTSTQFKTLQWSHLTEIAPGFDCRQDQVITEQFASLHHGRFVGEIRMDTLFMGPNPNDCANALAAAVACMHSNAQCGGSSIPANEVRHREIVDTFLPWISAQLLQESDIAQLQTLSAHITYR